MTVNQPENFPSASFDDHPKFQVQVLMTLAKNGGNLDYYFGKPSAIIDDRIQPLPGFRFSYEVFSIVYIAQKTIFYKSLSLDYNT